MLLLVRGRCHDDEFKRPRCLPSLILTETIMELDLESKTLFINPTVNFVTAW